jgi:hypothetical protein
MEDISVIFVLRDRWSKGGSVLTVKRGRIVNPVPYSHAQKEDLVSHMMAPSPATACRGEQESFVRKL